ncbi:MAG: threonine synthase [Planctomycetota bacterium]|jgi:threonine synthase
MKYISTRGGIEPASFKDVVLMGLADDGGLIIPEFIPDMKDKIDSWKDLSYTDLAYEVMKPFITDIEDDKLKTLINKSYTAFPENPAPLVKTGDVYVLELFHGPTLAFKDFALQLLGNLFEHILEERNASLNILGATSGDTGSAAIYGVRGKDRINIFVMHPHNRVSPVQERQMTTVLDENVHNIALEGTFDDCQNIMKDLFGDLDFKREYNLGAVNSVNWARVLAQVVYYFHAAFQLEKMTGTRECEFSVPTGNFGDILAGYYAMQMGLPVKKLILATNENDILSRFFNTGTYSLGEVSQTLSPSMDIQVASNFERYLYYLIGSDGQKLAGMMEDFKKSGALSVEDVSGTVFTAGSGSKDECISTISKYWKDENYLLDPHSAVGVSVAEKLGSKDIPVIAVSTAHPAKFAAAVEEATGDKTLAKDPKIDNLSEMDTRVQILPSEKQAVKEFMINTLP